MVSQTALRTRDARWRAPLEVLELVRREPGITRAAATQRLRLSTGSATEIAGRLRELALLEEVPAPIIGREQIARPAFVIPLPPRQSNGFGHARITVGDAPRGYPVKAYGFLFSDSGVERRNPYCVEPTITDSAPRVQ